MRRYAFRVAIVIAIGAMWAVPRVEATPDPGLTTTFTQYCVSCHNARLKTGGFVLDAASLDRIGEHRGDWEKVLRKLRLGVMPPLGAPRPDATAYEHLIASLESELDANAAAHPYPGRPVLHRLNRAEYANAVRD